MIGYNIHDVMRVQSNVDIHLPNIFKVCQVINPDLIVHIGDFELEVVKKGDNIYYYEHRLGPLKSKFMISNLFGKAEIYYESPRYRMQPRIKRSIIDLIHTVIAWKLLKAGYAFIYAACLERGGNGILIVAPSGVGKTLTSISLVKNYGFSYLSDDTVIIGRDGIAYCYPMAMKIAPRHLETFKIDVKFGEKVEMSLRRGLRRLPFLDGFISDFHMDIYRVLGDVNVKSKVKIEKIFLLEKGDDEIREVDGKTILNKILNYNFYSIWSWSNIFPLFLYTYYNPEMCLGDLLETRDEIIKHFVDSSRCFMVKGRNENYDRWIMNEFS